MKAQKERNKESKKPSKGKNADINKKKKWKKSAKGEGAAEKNDLVSLNFIIDIVTCTLGLKWKMYMFLCQHTLW